MSPKQNIYACLKELNYLSIQKDNTKKSRYENYYETLRDAGFDFRTIRGLRSLINFPEYSPSESLLKKLLDVNFYNLDNMVECYKHGLENIIPYYFYEESEFLERTGITKLPNYFLSDCKEIVSFMVPPQIKEIGDYAFCGCDNLIDLSMSDSITKVGHHAFCGCIFPSFFATDKLKKVGHSAFKNSMVMIVKLPGLENIEKSTFEDCTQLRKIQLENNIHIDDYAFKNCHSLKKIGSNILSLGENAFEKCLELKSVMLNVSEIPANSFLGCKNLEQIYFEINTPVRIGENSFMGCISLKNLYTDELLPNFMSGEGYKEVEDAMNASKAEDKNITAKIDIEEIEEELAKEKN